jgi:DNA-directed RNA polymerase specialized sigma24 family protein
MVGSSRRMGSFAKGEDHVHNVVVRLVEKIGRPDGRGVHLYPPWRSVHPDRTFADWMRIVVTNEIRDYVRSKVGSASSSPEEPSVKRFLNGLASSPALEHLGVRPPITAAQTARQILEFGASHLPDAQLRALSLWLEHATFEEIGRDLGVPPDAARKLLRAAIAVLRRHFAPSVPPDESPS